MIKILLAVFIATFSFADWCVYYSTQLQIHGDEDRNFLKRFKPSAIVKTGKYYRFLIGPFKNRKEAQRYYLSLKKSKPDIFVKECPKELKSVKKEKKKERLKTAKNTLHPDIEPADELFAKNALNKLTDEKKSGFYELSFYEFIEKLVGCSVYTKIDAYQYKIEKIERLLEGSVYNLDVFAQASVTYSKFIDYDLNENRELSVKWGLGFDKRVYDNGYRFVKNIRKLKEKLSRLKYLSSKDRLYLLGVETYLQTYLNQYSKSNYEEIFFEQKAILELAKERYKSGLVSKVDYLNARDDMLQIKMELLDKIYGYLYSDYLLRNMIELNVDKPLKLSEFGVEDEKKSIKEYIEEAYRHNKAVMMKKLNYMLSKELIERYRHYYIPQIDVHGEIYHEYRKDYSYSPNKSTSGLNYLLGLNLKIPLYNRTYFDNKERAKVLALKNREEIKKEFLDVARDIHKSYNELHRLRQNIEIVNEQLKIASERFELTKKRYISGLGRYEDLALSVKRLLKKRIELKSLKNQYLKNQVFLKILEGKQRVYE